MCGGPSQQDLFDYKPKLNQHHKKELFKRKGRADGFIDATHRITGMTSGQKAFSIAGSKYTVKQH